MAQICHQQLTFLKAFFQEKKKVLDKASYLLVNGRVPITVVKYYLEKNFFWQQWIFPKISYYYKNYTLPGYAILS